MFGKKFVRCLIVGMIFMSTTACAQMRLGELAVEETFSDARVVELTRAAMSGDTEKVLRLARAGVPINVVSETRVKATPLIWALYAKSLAGMKALLEAGADPNLRSVGGMSPLQWAAGGDRPDMLALLLRYGGRSNGNASIKFEEWPLMLASSQGRLENVKLLVEAGGDINAYDEWNHSAPNYAIAAIGAFDIAAYLLEHGYMHDLQGLARGVEIRHVPPNSERQRWKDKVIEMLKARGVRFPAFIPCYPPGDSRRKEENCK